MEAEEDVPKLLGGALHDSISPLSSDPALGRRLFVTTRECVTPLLLSAQSSLLTHPWFVAGASLVSSVVSSAAAPSSKPLRVHLYRCNLPLLWHSIFSPRLHRFVSLRVPYLGQRCSALRPRWNCRNAQKVRLYMGAGRPGRPGERQNQAKAHHQRE